MADWILERWPLVLLGIAVIYPPAAGAALGTLLVAFLVFGLIALAIWWMRPVFRPWRPEEPERYESIPVEESYEERARRLGLVLPGDPLDE